MNSTPVSTPTSNDSLCYQDTSSLASSFNDGRYMYSEQYKWEKHSSGVASRILNKMGFSGKGLGKTENGITEPIIAENLGAFSTSKLVDEKENKRKLLYVLSSSMLNQLDENRLGNNDVEVRVQCHGGCTIRCLYSHLPKVISSKPNYILLHIGSNDCFSKTYDVVLNELKKLLDHLKLLLLPFCTIILSLPSLHKFLVETRKDLLKLIFPT